MDDSGEAQRETNPYATPAPLPHPGATESGMEVPGKALQPRLTEGEIYSHRLRSGFLFREIELGEPLTGILTYSGWWFIQRVYWNDRLVWRKISWWTLEREIGFDFPPHSTSAGLEGRLEIEFGPGLLVRRLALLCDGCLVYEEGNRLTPSSPR